MLIGKMRESIELQSKGATRDAAGGEVVTWSTVATVFAQVQPISGREFVAMRAAQSTITHRFRLRYLTGINTGMRVLWGSVAYDIVEAINVDARNRQLELLCVGDLGNV